MKKKEAIERLAQELETRDQQAIERATEAAGAAAEVTKIVKDYNALAKDYLQRGATELAFERAMEHIERQREASGPVVSQPKPLHTHHYKGGHNHSPFHYTPLPKIGDARVEELIRHGWTAKTLHDNGYITL